MRIPLIRIFFLILILLQINLRVCYSETIDANKNLYSYCFFKAAEFDTATSAKFSWLKNHIKYFEFGVLAASGAKLPSDAILKEVDLEPYHYYKSYYYKNDFENQKTNAELAGLNNIEFFLNNKSALFVKLIDAEIENAGKTLRNGNAEVSAFFLGVIAKYLTSGALWPYGFGKNSPLGEAQNAVCAEYFNEIDKLAASDNVFKFNNVIEFDGMRGKYNGEEALKNILNYTLLDSYNPDPVKRMNAITMYNLLPMMDSLSKKVVVSKSIDSLTGTGIDYTEWENSYIEQIGKTLGFAINYLYEIIYELPPLNLDPPTEITNLKYVPYNRQILLHWNLSTTTRKIQNQFVYRKNSNNGQWELVAPVPASAQLFFDKNNVMNGKKYLYKVTVKEPLRPETEGKSIEAIAIDNQPPAKPSRISLEPGNNEFTLNFHRTQADNEYDLNSYMLYVYDDSGNLSRNIKLPKDFRKYVISGMRNDRRYKAGITAIDEAMNESEEEAGFVMPRDIEPPLPVSNLTATGKNNVINVKWNPSISLAEDLEYQILKVYDSTGAVLKNVKLGPGVRTYTLENMINDYNFKIGLSCADEVPNLSKEVFASATSKFEGAVFSLNKNLILQDSFSVTPFISHADLNNDGSVDILFNSGQKLFSVYNEKGRNLKIIPTNISISDTADFPKLFSLDLNNDKTADVVLIDGGRLKIFRRNLRGSLEDFTKYTKINVVENIANIEFGDINNDRIPDITLLQTDGKIYIFKNLGNFSFENYNNMMGITSEDVLNFIKIIDVNNDGYSDIVCQTNYKSDNKLMIYENFKSEKFNRKLLIDKVDLKISAALAADFNNDNFQDLIIAFKSAPVAGRIYNNFVFRNYQGRLILNEGNQLDAINDIQTICAGDYNIDGQPDIFMQTVDGKVNLYKNNNGNFELDRGENNLGVINSRIYQAFLNDNDGDGDNDLTLLNEDKLLFFTNNINSYKALAKK